MKVNAWGKIHIREVYQNQKNLVFAVSDNRKHPEVNMN